LQEAREKNLRSKKREPLSRERIVAEAFELVEEEGLAQFSTRKLAAALHCEAMSIYHHFPSKAHLLDAMVDHIFLGLEPPPAGLPFPALLRHEAYALRKAAHAHAAFFPYLAVHRLNTFVTLSWLNRVLGEFRNAGFNDRDAAHHFRCLGYYIMGALLDETSGYAKGPTAADPVPDEVIARDFENVVAAGPFFKREHWDHAFELGLGAMLTGIEKALKAG
jgi:AcrR family transcriptional regulator